MQVDPIKPTSKPHGTKRFKLQHDEPLSNFAFKFNLCRFSKAVRIFKNRTSSLVFSTWRENVAGIVTDRGNLKRAVARFVLAAVSAAFTRWTENVRELRDMAGRGLHSSTFRLNLSAFCRIGGAFRGRLGGVRGY